MILSQVKDSPTNHQAKMPATGGMRYISGAVRATPRTALTHPHASHPMNAETKARYEKDKK